MAQMLEIFPYEKHSFVFANNITPDVMGPILVMWINFNPTTDKKEHVQ